MDTNVIDKIYIGPNEVIKLYQGTNLVWEKSAPSVESFREVQKSTTTAPYGFYEYLPSNYDSQTEVPLLIFLHGSGERGNGNGDLNKVLSWGIPKQQNAGTWHHNFITLSPQWLGSNDDGYYAYQDLADFITYAKETYKVDESRIYLTGLSAGNWFIFYFLENLQTTHGIAAAVCISGVLENNYTTALGVAGANVPLWFLSNIGDPEVSWDGTIPVTNPDYLTVEQSVNGINAINPGLVEKKTGFNNSTHTGTWDGIYDSSLIGTANPSYDQFDESIYEWFLNH